MDMEERPEITDDLLDQEGVSVEYVGNSRKLSEGELVITDKNRGYEWRFRYGEMTILELDVVLRRVIRR